MIGKGTIVRCPDVAGLVTTITATVTVVLLVIMLLLIHCYCHTHHGLSMLVVQTCTKCHELRMHCLLLIRGSRELSVAGHTGTGRVTAGNAKTS